MDVQPPLRVGVNGPRLRRSTKPVREGHPLYGVLAALWHHGSALQPAARRSLLAAVLAGVPATPGRNGDDYNNVLVSIADELEVGHDAIAAAWSLSPKSVSKKATAGRTKREPVAAHDPATGGSTFSWGIEAMKDQSVLAEPLDPGTQDDELAKRLGMTPSWDGLDEDQRAAALKRFYSVLDREVEAGRMVRLENGAYTKTQVAPMHNGQ